MAYTYTVDYTKPTGASTGKLLMLTIRDFDHDQVVQTMALGRPSPHLRRMIFGDDVEQPDLTSSWNLTITPEKARELISTYIMPHAPKRTARTHSTTPSQSQSQSQPQPQPPAPVMVDALDIIFGKIKV